MPYWDVIKNCLVSFHGFTPQKANNSIERYFKRLKGDQKVIDLVTKEEAFYKSEREDTGIHSGGESERVAQHIHSVVR